MPGLDLGTLGGGLASGIAGLFSDDGSGEAADYYKRLADKAGGANPNITAPTVGTDQSNQQDVLRNLQGIYRTGGMDAIGKSQVAGAEGEANRASTARANQIGESARAGGMGNSAATLALKQKAGQDAGQQASEQAVQAAAGAEGRQRGALEQAAGVGSGISAAQDAVSRFNAMNNMGAQQASFTNRMNQIGTQGGMYGQGYGAQRAGDERTRNQWAGVGSTLGSLAGMF